MQRFCASHLKRFICQFDLDLDTEQHHLLILKDDLHRSYCVCHLLPEIQINVAMYATYEAHAEVLDCAFATLYEQPIDQAEMLNNNEAPLGNLDINTNVQALVNDACNARAQNCCTVRVLQMMVVILTMIMMMTMVIILMVMVLAMVIVMESEIHLHFHLANLIAMVILLATMAQIMLLTVLAEAAIHLHLEGTQQLKKRMMMSQAPI